MDTLRLMWMAILHGSASRLGGMVAAYRGRTERWVTSAQGVGIYTSQSNPGSRLEKRCESGEMRHKKM